MIKGKYLNPKYAKRERHRRRTFIATMALLLSLLCGVSILRVDDAIRSTMLPAAPPAVNIQEQQPMEYQLQLFGKEYHFSAQWVWSLGYELGVVVRTPPAPVRLLYQARAFLTGRLPRNVRSDPRIRTEL